MKKTNKLFILSIISLLMCGCPFNGMDISSSISSNSSTNETKYTSTTDNSIKEESTSNSTNNSSSSISTSTSNNSSSISTSTSSNSSSISTSTSSGNSSSGGTIQLPTNLYQATIENNAPDYYESVKGLKGEKLEDALHEVIKGHTTYAYNSSIDGYMKEYDRDYDNPNNINLIYTGSTNISTSFNKEHVWAKSHGDFGTSKGPGTDLHNLRPCNDRLNSTRGNLDFAEGGNEITSFPGNYKTSSTFEPRDDFKGDVARTIFYMATRYDKGDSVDLELESPTNTKNYLDLSNGANGVHGNFDDLYKWATDGNDPVDNFEVKRNNIIYANYQHNRNPFVDHPEFIIMIYDKNYNGPGALLDMNGQETLSPEELAENVEKLIINIGTVTLESESKIIEAEEAYNNLNAEAKKLVDGEIYQLLLESREKYDTLYNENIVDIVISLIDDIGEVTLDSETKIIKAEDAYNKLNDSQKEQVTNIEKLIEAREILDKLIEEMPKPIGPVYSGDFGNSSGAGAYGSATITLENQKWYASSCYQQGSEFRLGNNQVATIDSKFLSALNLSSVDGSSLEMMWNLESSSGVSFEIKSKYGTPNKIYILKSLDSGISYTKCAEFDYSDGEKICEYSVKTETNVRYALVVTGSKPRIVLGSVEIQG